MLKIMDALLKVKKEDMPEVYGSSQMHAFRTLE